MKNIYLKTDKEIKIMQEGGEKLSTILAELLKMVKMGVNFLDIENKATQLIAKTGGQPSFKRVPGYNWATCININEGVVHGIPKDYKIKDGDVISVDAGLYYKGFNTDACWTKLIQNSNPPAGGQNYKEKEKFLEIGKKALNEAIKQAVVDNRIGHISAKIQKIVEGAGYHCARNLTGHGVGLRLHEGPAIPCYVKAGSEKNFLIKKGMTLAIEVIYTAGKPDLQVDPKDKWTIRTKDGKISAVFEKTIAITEDGPLVLTKKPNYALKTG